MKYPKIIISALRGGAGKTVLSIGIISAWTKLGKSVIPFKKGPDYIDAGWLGLAANKDCYNLDTFLMDKDTVVNSFLSRAFNHDIAVIEGNRGLYDGIDIEGSTSTAELAKLLKAPVILCLDCTKSTRTMAAAVLGCMKFDSEIEIKGIILNHVAGTRHENTLRKNIEYYCGIPVTGAVPKLKKQDFPERHMGLIPTAEHELATASVNSACQIAKNYINLDTLFEIACDSCEKEICNLKIPLNPLLEKKEINQENKKIKIGIIKDSAFQFYYPENIEALSLQGAEIIFISPLSQKSIPNLDALYIGGGFPETHAQQLADNVNFRNELKYLAENGLPVYAECGGLMYLGESLILNGKTYPMTDVLPVVFELSKKPQGHGYTVVTVQGKNPYFQIGTQLKGHEFHYSKVSKWNGNDKDLIFSMKRGAGFINSKDGICYKNVLATYTHIHALGTPFWAKAVFENAVCYNKTQSFSTGGASCL